MKVFKILKQIFQICATALFLASIVICAIDMESAGNAVYLTAMLAAVGCVVVGTVGMFLLSSPHDTVNRIGHAFALSAFTIGLTYALVNIEASTAAILMLVAAVMLALYYLCILILKIMRKSSPDAESPNDDIRIVHVKEWKKIMEEGIISPEEYEAKRCQILGIEKKDDPENA